MEGHVFRLATGERFTVIECSDFNLFGRYVIEGPDAIRPVLADRRAFGFNMLRVWAAYQGNTTFEREIGRLVPSEHPEMYAVLSAFYTLCHSYGCYIELTAFTGGPIPGHWEKVGASLPDLLELCNENDSHPDRIDINAYQPIPGVLCSHGSNGSQAIPPRPPWDYEVYHTNGAYQWPRKGGHNGMELSQGDAEGHIPPSRVPILVNENTRPDSDPNIQHHHDAAAGCALLIAGSCFHSASGKKSAIFSDFDRPFAEAFVRGAKSVQLHCQVGGYRHRADLEITDAGATGERVYQRGDDAACIVRIGPS